MTAGINDKFRKTANNFSTTLSSSIINGTDTTAALTSTTNLPTDTAIDLAIDRVDSTGAKTPAKREYVKAIVSGPSTLTSLTRGQGNSAAAGHAANAIVEAVMTAEAWNDLIDGILVQHKQDGTHGDITVGNLTVNGTLTQSGGSIMPIGGIMPFAGSVAPAGWLLGNGAAVSRATYANLFAVIGTTYGAGDGSTTFNVPNFKGATPVGLDAGQTEFNAIGKTGGEKTHLLTGSEMPVHSHGVSDPSHSHDLLGGIHAGGGGVDYTAKSPYNGSASVNWSDGTRTGGSYTGISIQNAGGGAAHNVLQPYITVNYIVKY